MSQLDKPIIVVGHYHGSLVEGLKLMYYRLAAINIKVVVLEQFLEHVPCYSLDIEMIPNSLI